MKVFMVNSVCGIRSTGRICTDIAEQLKASGHDCKIAYGREHVPPKYQQYAVRIGSEFGVRFHVLQTRIFDNSGFASTIATKKLIKQVKMYNPDVIHLHNIHGYYLNVEILFDYLKKANKPVIWTLHDCWSFTGHCSHFGVANCDKWQFQCFQCSEKDRYPASLFLDRSRKNYKRKKKAFTGVPDLILVTPSQWLADLTRKSFLKEYPVCVIHNGIDLSVFQPVESDFRKKYQLENKVIVMGAASSWNERKGLHDIVKLAEKLEDNYAIVIVGVTEQQKKELPKSVLAITRTESPKELAQIYTAADVFVNPTYEDNYPTVNLEAQACGTPVITYHTGGSVESVVSDCVVKQGDIEAMAEKIRRGAYLCREDRDFSHATMLQGYMELYKNALEK